MLCVPLSYVSYFFFSINHFCRNGSLPAQYVHVWALCTDNGADQAAYRAQLKTLLAGPDYSNQLIWDVACLKHQLHLLTMDMLRLASQFLSKCGHKCGYFSSLAKICHAWRAHAPKLAKVWQTIVPNAYSYKASSCVPPLAISGRWGSIDGGLDICSYFGDFFMFCHMFMTNLISMAKQLINCFVCLLLCVLYVVSYCCCCYCYCLFVNVVVVVVVSCVLLVASLFCGW